MKDRKICFPYKDSEPSLTVPRWGCMVKGPNGTTRGGCMYYPTAPVRVNPVSQ